VKATLLNDTSASNHYGCQIVIENIYKAASHAGIEIIHAVPVKADWQVERHLAAIRQSDIVLVNGEGTLHSAKPAARTLASVAKYCKSSGKKCYLFNTVYENNDEEIANLVREFDKVFVREGLSKENLLSVGIDAVVVPDMVFYNSCRFKKDLQPRGRFVVYGASAIKDIGRMLYTASLSRPGSVFLTLSADVDSKKNGTSLSSINRIKKNAATKLSLSSYVFLVRRLFRLGWVDYIPSEFSTKNIDELVELLVSANYVVTGFFHMTCFCVMAGVPFFALPSNTSKIQGMLGDIGLPGRLLASEAHFIAFEMTEKTTEFSPEELARIKRYLALAPVRINEMFAIFKGTGSSHD